MRRRGPRRRGADAVARRVGGGPRGGRPLRYRTFAPLGRDLSVLVLGTDVFRHWAEDAAESVELLDTWVELGGNVIDTGREYGPAERVLGRWLHARGLEDQVVVLTKGAHPDAHWRSRVTPEAITADLDESLATLLLESIDLYLLHRDDPEVPVGPILEVLNEHERAGRVRVFGASNWTIARLEEAKAYAAAYGLDAFGCSSPGLSLAVPNETPYPGAVTAHGRESREWYARTKLPLFAWSAQAAGFFAGVRNEFVERVYGGEANVERLRRAEEFARRNGCTANHVALAWVLRQPFPTYALIGPRSVEELRSSVLALDVELGPEDVRWLNLEEPRESCRPVRLRP